MISALTGEKAWPRQAHGWHRRHRERDPARADASMPSDDHTVVGNQHWIVEAEALDRRCDLLDSLLADLAVFLAPRRAAMAVVSANKSNGWRKVATTSRSSQVQFDSTALSKRRFWRGSCRSTCRWASRASSRICLLFPFSMHRPRTPIYGAFCQRRRKSASVSRSKNTSLKLARRAGNLALFSRHQACVGLSAGVAALARRERRLLCPAYWHS
jgi:hypothetical protein